TWSSELRELFGLLRHQIRHEDLFVRASAVAALAIVPDDEAIDLLVVAAADEETWIAEEASAALLPHGGASMTPRGGDVANVVRTLLRRTSRAAKSKGRFPVEVEKQLRVLERLL